MGRTGTAAESPKSALATGGGGARPKPAAARVVGPAPVPGSTAAGTDAQAQESRRGDQPVPAKASSSLPGAFVIRDY